MVNGPPQPHLVGLIVIITPHFVHFCRYWANFNINGWIFSPVFQVIFIDWLWESLRFFNTFVTVLGDIFKTRPVSLVPLPFIVISTICSFVPGRQALFLYSNWNVLWLHSLFRQRYLCLPVLFFPYSDTSLLPQYGHTTSSTAILLPSLFFLFYHLPRLYSTILRHHPWFIFFTEGKVSVI